MVTRAADDPIFKRFRPAVNENPSDRRDSGEPLARRHLYLGFQASDLSPGTFPVEVAIAEAKTGPFLHGMGATSWSSLLRNSPGFALRH